MTYSIASESLGGGVCFQACLLVCKGLGQGNKRVAEQLWACVKAERLHFKHL